MKFFLRSGSQVSEFVKWRKEINEHPRESIWIDMDHFRAQRNNQGYPGNYAEWIQEQLADDGYYSHRLSEGNVHIDIDKYEFDRLFLDSTIDLKLTDKKIKEVRLNVSGNVTIQNCFIEMLSVQNVNALSIDRSSIGTLRLFEGTANPFVIQNTAVFNFRVEAREPILRGDVTFRNLYVPRNDKYGKVDLSALKRTRASLVSSHNRTAAAKLQSIELAHERRHEPFISKIISYVYEWGADFGNSTVRPITWLLFSLSTITIVGWAIDGISIGDRDLQGWQKEIVDSRLLRAFIYAGQSILNPLGVFASKSLVVAKDTCTMVVMTPLSMVGTLSIVFFVISLRRRFKLEQ